MAPTKSTRRSKRHSKTKKSIQATYHAINKWYETVFEKLGWMVLAHKKGYTDKVHSYKLSLGRLKNAIETKISKIHEVDRKNDLLILHKNLLVLIDHVHKDFH